MQLLLDLSKAKRSVGHYHPIVSPLDNLLLLTHKCSPSQVRAACPPRVHNKSSLRRRSHSLDSKLTPSRVAEEWVCFHYLLTGHSKKTLLAPSPWWFGLEDNRPVIGWGLTRLRVHLPHEEPLVVGATWARPLADLSGVVFCGSLVWSQG